MVENKTRVDDALLHYFEAMQNKKQVETEDIQQLLDVYRKTYQVDLVYICETLPTRRGFVFSYTSASEEKYDTKGIVKRLTEQEYKHLSKAYEKECLCDTNLYFLEKDRKKAALHYGVIQGTECDGSIGMLDFSGERVWTEEERHAVRKLGRILKNLVVDARIQKIEKEEVEYYKSLFVNLAIDNYSSVLKLNINTGECVKIIFQDNQIETTLLVNDWNELRATVLDRIVPSDRKKIKHIWKAHINSTLKAGEQFSFNYSCCDKSKRGREYSWWTTKVKIVEEDGILVALLFNSDNTNDVKKIQHFKEKSEKDELTSLYSRAKLEEMMQKTYKKLDTCGVVFFDVNGLKETNDTLGHEEGDRLIRTAAQSIAYLQNQDVYAYRYGGDEFILVAANYTKYAMRKLLEHWWISWNKIIEGYDMELSMSVGMAWGKEPVSVTDLINEADEEMYKNKALMKNGCSLEMYIHKGAFSNFGLSGRAEFFDLVDEKVKTIKVGEYCLVTIDIDHFKLFNKWYGREAGDRFLNTIAMELKNVERSYNGISAYFGGDNFVVVLPYDQELLSQLMENLKNIAMKYGNTVGFLPAFGVYVIEDKSVPAITMYDFASEALTHVTGNYDKRWCLYDSSMTDQMEEELRLISEVKTALKEKQFTFVIQPKCCIGNGKVIGGEALVRWHHPEKGTISPSVFIPVLENNGFVGELDCYIWDEVCKKIRHWLDIGLHPVPISINVSRIDMLSMDVVEYLSMLTKKYNIPHDLLKVEITESAYVENGNHLIKTIEKLREAGFAILMDDFGSGYSSLNMLKSVIVDVIKIDMRFLDISDEETNKGIGILESVINMSSSMGIPVIIEGVETKQQEDYLIGMGCRYAQGYFYYKPMSIDEFEKILSNKRKIDFHGICNETIEQVHVRELLDITMFNDTLINQILGPVAFYDLFENNLTIRKINNQYHELTGMKYDIGEQGIKDVFQYVYKADWEEMLRIFRRASDNMVSGASGAVRYIRPNGKLIWMHMRVYRLRDENGHKRFIGLLTEREDIYSSVRQKQKLELQDVLEKRTEKDGAIEIFYDELPVAFGLGKIILDEKQNPYDYDIVYANKELRRMSSCDIARMKNLSLKLFSKYIGDIFKKIYNVVNEGICERFDVYGHETGCYMNIEIFPYRLGYVGFVVKDITKSYIYEVVLGAEFQREREVYFIHLEDDYYRVIYPDKNSFLEKGSYTNAICNRFRGGSLLSQESIEKLQEFLSIRNIKNILENKDIVEYPYERRGKDGQIERCTIRLAAGGREENQLKTVVMIIMGDKENT